MPNPAPTETIEGFDDMDQCPKCESGEIHYHGYEDGVSDERYPMIGDAWRCQNCGFQWYGQDAVTPDMVAEIGMLPKWGEDSMYKKYVDNN